jgi:hypothetical protein
VKETKALFALIFEVLLQEKRLRAKSWRLRTLSLADRETLLNLFKIMNSCGLF